MKKAIIYTSIIWVTLVLVSLLLEKNEIYSSYLIVENIRKLVFFFVWIVPILLITQLKKNIIKDILLIISFILFLVNSESIVTIGISYVKDLYIGNGYRQIFEKKLPNNTYFSIYKSPENTFPEGGSFEVYTINTKYILGFIKRHSLNKKEYEVQQNIPNKSELFIIGKDTVFVDNKLLQSVIKSKLNN